MGNIQTLKQEQANLGFYQPDDIAFLIDESSYNQNALFVSCLIKDDKKAYDMTEYLIKEAKCNALLEDSLNQTCLFYVCRDGREQLVKLFLENGCKANHVDSYGQTPIFYTAREGHRDIMKVIIEAGGDPDQVDHEGQTPIFYATRQGQQDCIDCLVKEYEVDLMREDNKGHNLIQVANKYKRPQLIEQFIQVGVPCPPDIKRKLALAQQKSFSTRSKKRDNQPNEPGSDTNQIIEPEAKLEVGGENSECLAQSVVIPTKPKDPVIKSALLSTFTPTQQKEILK